MDPATPSARSSQRRNLTDAAVVALISLAFYLLTQAENLSSAHDSISYIARIEGGEFFHPHHLLYGWLARRWLLFCRLFSPSCDSIYIVQVLSAVFGALSLSLFYLILRRRLSISRGFALTATLLPAFSFGFWFYSTVVEVYVIPLFFVLGTTYVLTSESLTLRKIVGVGLLHAAAILFHQVHVLFLFAVLVGLVMARARLGHVLRKAIATYLVVVFVVTFVPYVLVAVCVEHSRSPAQMWDWLTIYAQEGQYWREPGLSAVLQAVFGFTNSIVGGHFLFALPEVKEVVGRVLGGGWLEDEAFLVRNVSSAHGYVLLGMTALAALGIGIGFCRGLRSWRQLWVSHSRLLAPLVVCFFSYSAFFLFWQPSNLEFWIPQSLVAWLLGVALVWQRREAANAKRTTTVAGIATMAALLLIVNYAGSVRWLMDRENDYYYAKAKAVAERGGAADLVIIAHPWILQTYLERYSRTRVLSVTSTFTSDGEEAVAQVRRAVAASLSEGNKVFVFEDAVSIPDHMRVGQDPAAERSLQGLWRDYREHWIRLDYEFGPIYVLESH